MSKKVCFRVFAASLIAIMTSFVAGFTPITAEVTSVFNAMCGVYLSITAVVTSFLLKRQKHYWVAMFGIATITAIVIELLVVGGSLISLGVIYKIIAFMVYAYLVRLIRYMV